MLALGGLLALTAPSLVRAHGGTPQVRDIVFPSAHGHRPFALTDNQGVYAQPPGEPYRWLCEDAVAPFVQLRTFAVLGDGRRWLAGTLDGLLASDDGGCDRAPVEGALGTDDGADGDYDERPPVPLDFTVMATIAADHVCAGEHQRFNAVSTHVYPGFEDQLMRFRGQGYEGVD